MAIIKCPECGRENVSDSAESCPSCGYGIKAHFNAIKAKEERRRNEEERKAILQQLHEKRLADIKQPEKPKFSRGFIVYIIVASILISALFLFNYSKTYIKKPLIGDFLYLLAVFIGFPLIMYLPSYIKRVKNYEFAKRDFEAYKRQFIKNQDDTTKHSELVAMKQMYDHKCPLCNSTSIERITTLDRAISIGVTGLASGKIGKQYKCKSCKHMW